jgi:hypothetical protein
MECKEKRFAEEKQPGLQAKKTAPESQSAHTTAASIFERPGAMFDVHILTQSRKAEPPVFFRSAPVLVFLFSPE